MSNLPDYATLMARKDAPPGSSWGLFGTDDELGTINFQTPERILAASRAIRRGDLFNLDCPLDAFDPPTSHQRSTCRHTIFGNNPHHRDDFLDGFYLQASSQIDSLRHMRHPVYGFYNNARDEDISVGSARNGVGKWAEHGIAGRGVLIDLERHCRDQGRPLDQDSSQQIPVAMIDDAAKRQNVEIRAGDILMLRTGWIAHYFNVLSDDDRKSMRSALRSPGLLQSRDTLAWLWDHRISICAADNVGVEAFPPHADSPFAAGVKDVPGVTSEAQARLMHPEMIALLGLVLGELWNLERLAEDCARDGVWECFVTVKPLNLRGGVGSPANATAIK